MSKKYSPALKHLGDQSNKAFLISLRDAVAPILANNLLPHFTDHSVTHSDQLTSIVDELIQPIQGGRNRLLEEELMVLYSSCYLHDIGMQYENIGSTKTISSLNLSIPWEEIAEEERRSLLRDYHHLISAELVWQASQTGDSLIGIHIPANHHPDCIASLCEAQNVDVGSERHKELTQDIAGIRVFLLSGLLRLSDILDESRTRAVPDKAKTLLLDICSQSHWWRHYYTEKVTYDQAVKTIFLHFDFPKGHEKEYQTIIPHLQIPWIQKELSKHAMVFNQAGLGWSIDFKVPSKPYSTAKEMPLEVKGEMLKQLHARNEREAERHRRALLESFEEAQPYITQRLDELQYKRDSMHPKDYLLGLEEISKELWNMGAKRSAWMLLSSSFNKSGAELPPNKQLELGMWIANAMLEDNFSREAFRTIQQIKGLADHLLDTDETKGRFFILLAKAMVENCLYKEATIAIEEAINFTDEMHIKVLKAQLCELHLLYGELGRVLEIESDAESTG